MILKNILKSPIKLRNLCSPSELPYKPSKSIPPSLQYSYFAFAPFFELDSNGVPVNYQKKISGIASAYSGGTVTSTGMKPRTGYVAVDPQKIPYGSRLFIRCQDGSYIYGYAVAQDTGSFIRKTNRIVDLYFNSKAECVRFGLRNVDIYVL